MNTLVLGGARSGKSSLAERLVRGMGGQPTYIATAVAGDDEMRARISQHRANGPVLVDCLTLWLSNLMFADRDVAVETAGLLDAMAAGPVVLVSNEVGMGLVPETPLGRRFRDAQGRLNQAVAAAVPRVLFVAAGLPITLKAPLEPT